MLSTDLPATNSKRQAFRLTAIGLGQWLPYLAFVAAAVIYAVWTLPDGYTPNADEGFLQSVANRLVNGEVPYRDFHYWRTPLSIYMQAFLIWIANGSYTIIAARVFCLLQLVGLTIIVSLAYRKLVGRLELFFLLCTSFALTSMLLTFPWYSYDAVFFAGVALYCAHRRRWFGCGASYVLAALAKQNYGLLLPLFMLVAAVIWLVDHKSRLLTMREALRAVAGAAVVAGAYLGYLLIIGTAGEFINQVIIYPGRANPVDLQFFFFQDHAEALKVAWPYLAVLSLLIIARPLRWWLLPVGIGILAIFARAPLVAAGLFAYVIVLINYAAPLAAVLRGIVQRWKRLKNPPAYLTMLLVFGVIIQYLSGFNMSGLFFSSMGAGVAMPFVHLTIRDWDKTRSARVLAALFLCFMLIGAAHHKYHFMYHEFDRDVLSATYTWPKLAGVRSTPGRVESTERLLNLIERNSDKGDYIFLYPDYSSAYYLTGRRNPTGIDWYYLLGGVPEIVDATLKRMEQNRPRVIVIDGPCHNVYLNTLVSRHYQVLDTIDQMIVYHLPSDSVAAP